MRGLKHGDIFITEDGKNKALGVCCEVIFKIRRDGV